jgi:hypothetical protein
MLSRIQLTCFLTLFALAAPSAHATTPEELWNLPWPASCDTELGLMKALIEARDKGISAPEAQDYIRKLYPGQHASAELLANVFGHPELGSRELGRYTLWVCHARAYKVPTLPLGDFAADLLECSAKFRGDPCVVELKNRVTGLPADYRPKSKLVPTPAPSSSKSQ